MFVRGLLVFLWLAWSAVELQAAGAALRGFVLTSQEPASGVEGVLVDAPGAKRTETDESGCFTLQFPDQRPGDLVNLTVEKEGYEVVNFVQLETRLPEGGENASFVVFLCKAGDREEATYAFYHARAEEVIEAEWYQRIAAAESEGTTAVDQLRHDYLQAHAIARTTDWNLAAIRPGENCSLFRRSMRLFLEGNVYAAVLYLDNDVLRAAVAEASANEETDPEALMENAIQPWLLKAHLYAIQLRFVEAEAAYQTAVDAVPDSLEVSYSLALFHRKMDRPLKAITAYQRCITLAKKWGRYGDLGVMLNELGMLYDGQHEGAAARSAFEESTRTLREVARTQPERYLPGLAAVLCNLGRSCEDEERLEAAQPAFAEALGYFRELASGDAETYLPDVALTLRYLAYVNRQEGRDGDARVTSEEAIKIYRDLARTDPKAHLPNLAAQLWKLGRLNQDEKQWAAAESGYLESLGIRRELARTDPESYLPDMAQTLGDLADVLDEQDRSEEARDALEEAVQLYRKLGNADPEKYLLKLAYRLAHLGILHGNERQFESACPEIEEALQILRDLAQADPDSYAEFISKLGERLEYLEKQK